ncbi:MAG: ATP synthase F1 subunit epsilon [Eubacterium sp.]|nr:ATP synthase F1 subunit epsilon [Eubacterium sp.]MCI8918315.1 ATP synthase F1 subunit epsilon [Eubacterium sp.]
MSVFQASILAADCVFYEGPCEYMSVPALMGQYGIQAHHCNAIGAVVPGMLSFRVPGQPVQIASVSEGLVKIENNEVLVLVDSAERPEEIDENRAKRAADEAKEALLQKRSIQENRIAQAQLARAVSRLRIKRDFEHMQ